MSHLRPANSTRLLFASYHCYLDPSSGAAVSVRTLLQQLAASGWETRTLCGPALDFDHAENVRQLLADEQLICRERFVSVAGREFVLRHFQDGEIGSSIFLSRDAPDDETLERNERGFVALYQEAINDWRPDVVLTFGGSRHAERMLRLTKENAIPVVFWLHNLAYHDAGLFQTVDRVLVPSEFSRKHHRENLGLDCRVIPCPFDWERLRCDQFANEQYVTFVNPELHKGVFVFARIAEQLHHVRPDIRILVVEGRSGVAWLQRAQLDLSELTSLNVMKNTPDPRDFLRASRMLLVPSLCEETFGRVAAEAMIGGTDGRGARRPRGHATSWGRLG